MNITFQLTWHLGIFIVILIALFILLFNVCRDNTIGDLGSFMFGVPVILLILLTIVIYGGIYWW